MIKSLSEFKQAKVQAEENPGGFWSEVAREFHWKSPWKQTLDYDFSIPEVKWFIGGKLNITENCLDRHLATQPNKIAILLNRMTRLGRSNALPIKNCTVGFVKLPICSRPMAPKRETAFVFICPWFQS